MRTISAELLAHLQQPYQTIATCWKVTRTDATVLGFTDHDQDLVFSGVTYASATGYTATDVASSSALDVDNLELAGVLASPSITEADLLAGLWDNARIEVFLVNWDDLTMGRLIQRVGHLGEVTVERGKFRAEMRGLIQAYGVTIGELDSPTCRANLGDVRCGVNLALFTVTGAITGVHADGVTLYDTSRTEPGPAGGVAITGITNANPGVVTVADASGLTDGDIVNLSGIVGPELLNTDTIIRNINSVANTFELAIDTSDTSVYPAYVSGGTVTPLGADAGYFAGGVITFTAGANDGLAMEIKSYTVGQFVLQLPMPYPVAIGDTYSLIAGCPKTLAACRDTFNNVVNFRGEPHLPGLDKMVQVGRRS